MTERRRDLRLSANLAILATVNIMLAFGTTWYAQTRLGLGQKTDALNAGLMVPQVLVALIGNAIAQVLVSVLAAQQDDTGRRSDAWTLLLAIGSLHTALAVVLGTTAELWVPLLVPAFESPTQQLTVDITRITLVGMVFNSLLYTLRAYQNATHRFVWVEITQTLGFVASLPILYFGLPRIGVAAAAWATVVTFAVPVFLLVPTIGRPQRPEFRGEAPMRTWDQLTPLLGRTTYYETDIFLERYLASLMGAGFLSVFSLADRLYTIGNSLVNKALITPVTPNLARSARDENWERFHGLARSRLRMTLILTFLCIAALFLVGRPVLMLIFAHGKLTAGSVDLMWCVLIARSGVFIGINGRLLTVAALFARGETRLPARVCSWAYTLFLPIKVFAALRFGIIGLAVVSSIHSVTTFVIQAIVLSRMRQREAPSNATEATL